MLRSEDVQTMKDLERAVRDLTRAQAYGRNCQVRVMVYDPGAIGGTGWSTGQFVNVLDANPDRVKLAFGRHSGAGALYMNTVDPSSTLALPFGIKINADWPPYVEEAPFVHKGPWYLTADAAATRLWVVEYSLAQGQTR